MTISLDHQKKNSLKIIIFTIGVLFPGCIFAARSIKTINNDWLFYKANVQQPEDLPTDLSQWEPVNLPHTWNATDPFDYRHEDDGLDITMAYYRGVGWYRKTIQFNPQDARKLLFLKFEGANTLTDVWVNGNHVGNHVGGYSGFEFEISAYLKFGKDNQILVRVNNSYNYDIPPQSADYTMYGGIYRDVYLVRTEPTYIKNALIETPEVSFKKATVNTHITIDNKNEIQFEGMVLINIFGPDGKMITKTDRSVNIAPQSSSDLSVSIKTVNKPKLWSPESASLYRVEIRLMQEGAVVDLMEDKFGFRWYRFDPDEGFFLNGTYLRLQGVNRHQDRAGFGNALSNEMHREDMQLIKSVGANFVRLAHYPQDPAVLDACDSLGLLVWEEIPVVRSVGKRKFARNAEMMLREMIIQHYNHPSIIIWGLMNEVMRDQRDEELHWAVDLCRELNKIAKSLDPYRYTAQAQFKDRSTEILTLTDIIGYNKYYGWYSETFDYFGKHMDEQKQLYPEKIFIISEYGAGSKRGYHIENPVMADFSENWQLKLHQSYWQQIIDRKYIAASAIWNMFDFGSHEKGGNIPHINQKGLMTFDRKPKDVFYFYQSQWLSTAVTYIVSHTWRKRSGSKDEIKKVEVLSNCEKIELFVNNQSRGVLERPPFVWKIKFQNGMNYIRALGYNDSQTVEDLISLDYMTTKPPTGD